MLASQLLQKNIVVIRRNCRSRLAGEGGLEFYVGLEGLFAGKPAPTKKIVALPGTCRSRLAGEGGLEFCIWLEGPFAGKPAPTKTSWHLA